MALIVGGSSFTNLPPDAGSGNWWVKRQTPGTISATWTDPDGEVYNLTSIWHQGPGYFTMNGPASWGSTPVELITDPYPRGGEQVRYIRAKPRRVQWPLYVGGDSHMEFIANYRTIMKAFTKTTYRRAPGVLEIKRSDGSARRITAFYEQGFEGESGENWLWARPVIQLFCPDGYWYDPTPISVPTEVIVGDDSGVVEKDFLRPFITLTATPALDGGDQDAAIFNPGDVESWPVWTLSGPMQGFTGRNLTTGRRFSFTRPLDAGVTVTIITDPVTVRSSTGLNWTKHIDWFNTEGTTLWPVAPGPNNIEFLLDRPGSGATIDMTFLPRYETA